MNIGNRAAIISVQVVASIVVGVLASMAFAAYGGDIEVDTVDILSVPKKLVGGAAFGYPLGATLGAVLVGYLFNVKGSIANGVILATLAALGLLALYIWVPATHNPYIMVPIFAITFPLAASVGYNIRIFGGK
jgi:hypothetical protein